jgi:hypothetical protein
LTNNTKHILQENDRRNNLLNGEYDPVMGTGSPLDRFEFFYYDQQKTPLMLPVRMKDLEIIKTVKNYSGKKKTCESYCRTNGINLDLFLNAINEARLDYDFEFWAFTGIQIKNKDGGKDIQFKLNYGQRKLLKVLMAMMDAGVPIRVILLKARQWGGSTLTQIFMLWIQTRHKTNWNSLIAAHLKQAATNIRSMLKKAVKTYPYQALTLTPFEGTTNIKIIPERSNKITIGSMETPDSIRSEDLAMAHLSEVGLWRKTEGKKPEDLIQTILGTIQLKPMTMVVMESTAKGVGNFFHQSWTDAKEKEAKGTGIYRTVFVAWWEIEMYRMPIDTEAEKLHLLNTLDEYEKELWDMGATLEGIKWYRAKLSEYIGDRVSMCSEYPSNDIEAFQSSGQRFFPSRVVQRARQHVRPPKYVGEIYALSLIHI